MTGSLWHERNFQYLWAATTLSLFGTRITAIALPLTAALTLEASPFELGLISAMSFVPYLLFSLFVGAWLDRRRKKRMLVTADLIRAAVFAVVPIAAFTDTLSIGVLVSVAFTSGACAVVADIGGLAFLPLVVRPEQLPGGNARLEFSNSTATVTGAGLGGLIVQLVTAPYAIVVNAVAALLSAILTSRLRVDEPAPPPREQSQMRQDIVSGVRFVVRHRVIRPLVGTTLLFNLFTFVVDPVFILFMTRELELSPFVIGVIFSSAGVGSLLGALTATRLSTRFGYGKTLIAAILVASFTAFLVPLAAVLPTALAIAVLVLMHVLDSMSVIVYNVNQRTLRALATPDDMQARMNGTIRLAVMGVAPLGALVGGLMGGILGLVPTLLLAAGGMLLAVLPMLAGGISRLETLDDVMGSRDQMPNEHGSESKLGSGTHSPSS